ncbi:hypothetical protein B0H34DRAFT_710433 [Crassisporium funariophilum]|nr:hypothetical protein B0H34DRAFT_710433 [Crassisporium funariophilum]
MGFLSPFLVTLAIAFALAPSHFLKRRLRIHIPALQPTNSTTSDMFAKAPSGSRSAGPGGLGDVFRHAWYWSDFGASGVDEAQSEDGKGDLAS